MKDFLFSILEQKVIAHSLVPRVLPLHGFLVSRETLVLRRWESENKNLVVSNELIKVELPPWKIQKADVNSFDKTQFLFSPTSPCEWVKGFSCITECIWKAVPSLNYRAKIKPCSYNLPFPFWFRSKANTLKVKPLNRTLLRNVIWNLSISWFVFVTNGIEVSIKVTSLPVT